MNTFTKLASIRYEDGPWPLWRIDLSLRYILRSFLHERNPRSDADQDHYNKNKAYLKTQGWKTRFQGERKLHFKATGDLMWIRTGFSDFLAKEVTEILQTADLRFVNLETPIHPMRKVPRWVYDTLVYNAPESFLQCYLGKGKSHHLISICNNHAGDQGLEGVNLTKAIIEKNTNAVCLGGNDPQDMLREQIVNDVKICSIGSTYHINQFHRKDGECWPDGVPVLNFGDYGEVDWNKIKSYIDECKLRNADLIIFAPHWGYEYEYWPGKIQRAHAYRLIEMGVDIILGTSPHVLQPIEIVSVNDWDRECPVQLKREGKPRAGVIAYSLGNFATIMPTIPCKTAGILDLKWSFGAEGELGISDISFIPTVMRGKVQLAEKNNKYWKHAYNIMGDLIMGRKR